MWVESDAVWFRGGHRSGGKENMRRSEVTSGKSQVVLSLLVVGLLGLLLVLTLVPTQAVDNETLELEISDSDPGMWDVSHAWTVEFSTFEGSDSMDSIELDYSEANLDIEEDPDAFEVSIVDGGNLVFETVEFDDDIITIDIDGEEIDGDDTVLVEVGPIFTNPEEVGTYEAEITFAGEEVESETGTAEFTIGTGIAGTVENEDGEPLEDVAIDLDDGVAGGTTNVDGEYAIEAEPGTYDVQFEKDGYITTTHLDIEIPEDEVLTFDLVDDLALTGAIDVDPIAISDDSAGAEDVEYNVQFSPENPINDVSYFSLNYSDADSASVDDVTTDDITLLIDGDGGMFEGVHSAEDGEVVLETVTPLSLSEGSTVEIAVDGVSNPTTGGDYWLEVGVHEVEQPELPKSLDAQQFSISDEDSPTGEIAFAEPVTENNEEITLDVDFDNTTDDNAFVYVQNLDTLDDAFQEVTESETVTFDVAAEFDPISPGEVFVAELYDDPDLVTELDTASTEVVEGALLDECTLITDPGTYYLTQDLLDVTQETCIDIQSDDVEFDGQGHEISGDGDGAAGVWVGAVENAEVHNVTVSGWTTLDAGIYAEGSRDLTVRDVNASSGWFGIRLTNVDGFTIEDSRAEQNQRAGVQIFESANGELVNIDASENALANGWSSVYIRDGSSNVALDGVTAVNSPDEGSGITVTNGASDISVTNSRTANNDEYGFQLNSDSVTVSDIAAIENTWDVAVNSEEVLADNVVIGDSTAPDTELSFEAGNTRLRSVDSPTENPEATAIDRYVEIEETGGGSYFNAQLRYIDEDVAEITEEDLRLWSNDGSGWEEAVESVVDTERNAVTHGFAMSGTIGIFAPALPGELEHDPSELTFSDTSIGNDRTMVLSVENAGVDTLVIDDVSVTGSGADAFSVSESAFTLEPGDELENQVTFSPEAEGTYEASLVFVDGAGEPRASVPLEATASERSQPTESDDDEEEDEETETRIESESQSDDSGASVESSVENATGGERVNIEVPEPSEEQNYRLDGISVTPGQNSSFNLNIDTSSQPLETTPDAEFEFNRTTNLGYISVDTDLDNDDIDETEFTFRVREEQLDEWESGPQDVSLYRHDEETGTWEEHETEVVEQDNGDVLLRTTADGFSDWTAAAKRPDLDITDTEIDVEVATTEDDVTIQVFVRNTGGADGTYEAQLLANDEIVDREDATVPSNRTVIIDFVRTFEQPDLYEVQVNDVPVGQVNITEDEEVDVDTSTPTPDDAGSEDDETGAASGDDGSDDADDGGFLDGFGPGFGFVSTLAAIVAGGLYLRRRVDG